MKYIFDRKIEGKKMVQCEYRSPNKSFYDKITVALEKMTPALWERVFEILRQHKYDEINRKTSALIEGGTYDFECADAVTRTFSSKKENQDNAAVILTYVTSGIKDALSGDVKFEYEGDAGAMYTFANNTEFINWHSTGMTSITDIYTSGKLLKYQVSQIGLDDVINDDYIAVAESITNFIDAR